MEIDKEKYKVFQHHSQVYKALAHPTRLFIVHEISERKRSVSDLANLLQIDVSTMSKHLEILKREKIISGHKEANQVFYKLEFKCVLNFFNCISKNMSDES